MPDKRTPRFNGRGAPDKRHSVDHTSGWRVDERSGHDDILRTKQIAHRRNADCTRAGGNTSNQRSRIRDKLRPRFDLRRET
jgi:hypothetical protein